MREKLDKIRNFFWIYFFSFLTTTGENFSRISMVRRKRTIGAVEKEKFSFTLQ
jgi:hypothetical protein